MYLQIGHGLVELLHPANPSPDETFGITHVAFLTDDLDRDFAQIIGHGARELTAPKVAGTGIGRLAFVESPAGARVELIQRDLEMRVADAPHPVASIASFALAVGDVSAELAFFRDGLGMLADPPAGAGHSGSTPLSVGEAQSGAAPARLQLAGDALAIFGAPPASRSVFARVAISVPDRPRAPLAPGGEATDPDGVRFEVVV